jgi:hypothetical protein
VCVGGPCITAKGEGADAGGIIGGNGRDAAGAFGIAGGGVTGCGKGGNGSTFGGCCAAGWLIGGKAAAGRAGSGWFATKLNGDWGCPVRQSGLLAGFDAAGAGLAGSPWR